MIGTSVTMFGKKKKDRITRTQVLLSLFLSVCSFSQFRTIIVTRSALCWLKNYERRKVCHIYTGGGVACVCNVPAAFIHAFSTPTRTPSVNLLIDFCHCIVKERTCKGRYPYARNHSAADSNSLGIPVIRCISRNVQFVAKEKKKNEM